MKWVVPVIRESQVSKSNVTLYSGVTIQIRGADNPDRLRAKAGLRRAGRDEGHEGRRVGLERPSVIG